MGRPAKVNLGEIYFETMVAVDLALDIALPKNKDKWPLGFYQNILEFQNHIIKNCGHHKTLGDHADEYINWLQAKRDARKKI